VSTPAAGTAASDLPKAYPLGERAGIREGSRSDHLDPALAKTLVKALCRGGVCRLARPRSRSMLAGRACSCLKVRASPPETPDGALTFNVAGGRTDARGGFGHAAARFCRPVSPVYSSAECRPVRRPAPGTELPRSPSGIRRSEPRWYAVLLGRSPRLAGREGVLTVLPVKLCRGDRRQEPWPRRHAIQRRVPILSDVTTPCLGGIHPDCRRAGGSSLASARFCSTSSSLMVSASGE